MLLKLPKVLTVEEADLPRVKELLETLLRAANIAAMVLIGITGIGLLRVSVTLFVSDRMFWVFAIGNVLLLVAIARLRRLYQRGLISETVNLLLAIFTLYLTLIAPPNLLAGPLLIAYTVPIVAASLILTSEAGIIWALIVNFAYIGRAALVSGARGTMIPTETVVLGVILLLFVTLIVWFLGYWTQHTQRILRRHVRQGQAGIDIGHTVTSSRDLSSMVRQAVNSICDAFDYYYVGLFLIDPQGGNIAVLMDAAGKGASTLIERDFWVSLGGTTVVAAAVRNKATQTLFSWQERRATGGQPLQFTYGRLPTRAELVIPLQVGNEVLGALDIQSTEIDPFPEEDIHTLEGLAGHIANAMESTRLLDDIKQRHRELAAVNAQTERRARYLEATAELAQAISSVFDVQQLLERAVELISKGLDLYHTGIFLIDDTCEWAVLTAANSKGGKRMVARGHRLRVGEQGIVGWVTHSGQPRIALDVGEDPVYFDNLDLPDTRSEMALPLKVRDRIIGALDVQSTRGGAFSEEDVAVLQTLADQTAIAIENARLFQQTQQALDEVQALQRYYVAQEWQRLTSQRYNLNAEYRSLGVPEPETDWTPEMQMAWEQETSVVLSDFDSVATSESGDGQGVGAERSSSQTQSALAVPIRLRGEVIGVLDLQETDEPRHWSEEEVSLASTVADQVAQAIENARLLEETHRRAAQLSAAAKVARDATAILDVDQLLDETVRLISREFGYYHVGVFLIDDNKNAVLQAASSEGGRRMLERGYKLKVGGAGTVGYVAATGEPRIVEMVDTDSGFFSNPDLPDTLSEMALPLKSRGRAIGVLDVQSTEKAAFSEEDVRVLQTMADQLASAIENARLFREVRADAARRTLINEVLQAATQSLEPDEILIKAGQAISRQMEMPTIIFKHDAEFETLQAVAIHNSAGGSSMPDQLVTVDANMCPALFDTVKNRQLSLLSDIPHQVSGEMAHMIHQLGLIDAACSPLITRDKVLGLLVLGRRQADPPLGDSELSFARIVSANLSIAIENAQLFQDALETGERLKEADRLKSQFLANMSHELRTPLNSIIGFSRVILKGIDGPLTELQKTDLTAIHNSGQHLLGLINDILDISKIEAGKMDLHFEETDLRPLTKGVMATAIGLVKDKTIELDHHVPDDLPLVWADGNRIRQVLLNLISNAAKFTEGGKITLIADYDEEHVMISISDTGIGVPEDKMDSIFEEFTQVDGSSTRRAGGTGLGLPISRRFVEMHGGTITVESQQGVGSTFTVTLPIHPTLEKTNGQVPPPEEQQSQDQGMSSADQRLVLAVDDDQGVISLYKRFLEDQGYQVVGVTNNEDLLERVQQLQPFAIILDVLMPGKDGWQVLRDLKNHSETQDIPVIVCSIVSDEGRGFSLGAADYLVKPIMEEDLLDALSRIDHQEVETEVLVVDDQVDDILLIRRILEAKPGYRVVEASNGRVGMEMVGQHLPDIIILDLMMPELDGFGVLEALKREPETREIPVIVVTAKELTEEERRRLNGQVKVLLQKGLFTQSELLQDVERVLERMRARASDTVL